MKSRFFTIVKPLMFLLVISLLCWLPATAFSSGYNSDELTRRIKTGGYLQKTDNLMIIIDGTGELGWLGRETAQVKIAKALVQNIGNTIPNIPHRRMLRVFGPTADSFQEEYSTTFGLFNIDARHFTAITATKTHGISDNDPMELNFFAAINDFRKIDGTHSVILISRGDQFSKQAMAESAYLKKAFGGSICFYPIYIGNTPKAEAKMQQFQRIGGCGTFSTYADVDSPEEMTNFVESVFFAKKRTFSTPQQVETVTDEQKMIDHQTPEDNATEIIEDPYEPELIGDIDDTITDETTSGDVIIIERQLPHDKVVTIELHVEFDLNKATVKEAFDTDIQNIADFMLQYPETEVLLDGHTCSLGTDEYNMNLSSQRAEAVQNSLINKFGIPAERIKTRGAGESEPIADNANEEGRVRNRRVMAVISTIVTDFIIIEQEILREDFLKDDFVLPPIEESLQEQIQPSTETEVVVEETIISETSTEEGVTEQVTTVEIVTEEATTEEVVIITEETTTTEIQTEDGEIQQATTVEVTIEKIDLAEEGPESAPTDVVVTEGESSFDENETPLTVPTDN